jgi:copper chaperone
VRDTLGGYGFDGTGDEELGMTTRTYSVDGMTCGHCVTAVTSEVSEVSGVSEVAVDLAAKTVTVTGDVIDDDGIRAAVAEAGYAVVD